MATLHVFKSTLPYVNYVFTDGKVAHFMGGTYLTSSQKEIDELNKEIADGHPVISVDSAQITVESDMLDPVKALKTKLREEILAELAIETAKAQDPNRDLGTSDQARVKPSSTRDVAALVGGEVSTFTPPSKK